MLIGLVRQDYATRTFHTIGVRDIKTWHAFGAPSHFQTNLWYYVYILTVSWHNIPSYFYNQ